MNTKNPTKNNESTDLIKGPGKTTRSSILRFSYEADDGSVSSREITRWDETRVYVRGYSTMTDELLTFRKDQILEVFSIDKLTGWTFNRLKR